MYAQLYFNCELQHRAGGGIFLQDLSPECAIVIGLIRNAGCQIGVNSFFSDEISMFSYKEVTLPPPLCSGIHSQNICRVLLNNSSFPINKI